MSGGHSSSGIGDAIKKGVGMVHGTGEAIRGNFNAAVDQAGGDRVGVDKNAAIASKGADEIEHGYHRTGHGAGVTPVDVDRERLNTNPTTTTNYGSHSTNTANKLDTHIDSDADHRANPASTCAQASCSQTDGTDYSTTPFGSKWEPQSALGQDHEYDEHCSCHAQHIHRSSISGGTNLEAAQELEPILGNEGGSTNYGLHRTDIVNTLGPGFDSDADHRSRVMVIKPDDTDESGVALRTETNSQTRVRTFTRHDTEPSGPVEPRSTPRSISDDKVHHGGSSKNHATHVDEFLSTTNPHKSDFLNLLD